MKKGEFDLKGFTIIEVSLVLAIAGLIFLMIFIALPALQRQQRDTARKEDITALISAVKKYQTNNRGSLPNDSNTFTSWDKFVGDYLSSGFEDPSTGEKYDLVISSCGGNGQVSKNNEACKDGGGEKNWKDVLNKDFNENIGNMYVIIQAKCSGDENTGVVSTLNNRKLAVLYKLEGGGVYCENS